VRISNERQKSNGGKIYVQSNLMSLLSGENNNQADSLQGGEFVDVAPDQITPMKASSAFDQSNVESSNETSNNISQNLRFLNDQ